MHSVRRAVLAPVLALVGALAAGLAVAAPAQASPAPAATVERNPVIFVHGLYGSPGNFATLRSRFVAAGYPEGDLVSFGYNSLGDLRTAARQFGTAVDGLLARTGARQVDVVTHSLGALPSRWAIKQLGYAPKVAHWYALSGPNQGGAPGTCPAPFSYVCTQAVQGSSFIRTLNAGDPTPGDVAYTTTSSTCDGVVQPAWTYLEGAARVDSGCVDHFALLRNEAAANGVLAALGT